MADSCKEKTHANKTRQMVIHQGDVFWLDAQEPRGSEPGYRRLYTLQTQ